MPCSIERSPPGVVARRGLLEGGETVTQNIIWLIIVAGCIAIAIIALGAMGIAVPGWVVSIGWVILVVVVAVLAIKFLVSIVGKPPGDG